MGVIIDNKLRHAVDEKLDVKSNINEKLAEMKQNVNTELNSNIQVTKSSSETVKFIYLQKLTKI